MQLPPSQGSHTRAQHPDLRGSGKGTYFPEEGRPVPGASEYTVGLWAFGPRGRFDAPLSLSQVFLPFKTQVKFLSLQEVVHEDNHTPQPPQCALPFLVIVKLTMANVSECSLCTRHCVKPFTYFYYLGTTFWIITIIFWDSWFLFIPILVGPSQWNNFSTSSCSQATEQSC